ncbi:hypothetical protein BJ875DRAFT_510086 [Amylocarpus encephaloides]|uniref:Uncharacterized protein n=1 Tax=Amylocarpus encephaloides TaxID=45428 RepID=A0A9P7YIC9_9HELO|nr:hypothetical protein BJ875DRAFT_510086 [Amylocarpus encephaloides]
MASKRTAKTSSHPSSSPLKSASKKRAAPASKKDESTNQPKRKRGRPSNASRKAEQEAKDQEAKEQKTLEEMLGAGKGIQKQDGDVKMADDDDVRGATKGEVNGEKQDDNISEKFNGKIHGKSIFGDAKGEQKDAFDEVKVDQNDAHKSVDKNKEAKTEEIKTNDKSVVQDDARGTAVPSTILEKGVIYFFFFRGRAGLEDLARSFMVLCPIPLGAKPSDRPLQNDRSARLIALPRKMLPKSQQDRFVATVEKNGQTIEQLREFLSSEETSNSSAVIPSAEGVYVITSTGPESHLAYHITVPETIGEVQQELGIKEKGSFALSVKNPEAPDLTNVSLDNPAQYPEELQKKFHGLRWMPLVPEQLEYNNTQILVIDEGMGVLGKAAQEMVKNKKDDEKEKLVEGLKKLDDEDHERVEGLKEDDLVFADLGMSSKEYSHLQTKW